MRTNRAVVLATLVVAACGGSRVGGTASPADMALAMRMPSVPQATFTKTDSIDVSLDMGPMGSMDMPMTLAAVINIQFAEGTADDGGHVRGTATVQSFSGRMEIPMAGTTELDQSAVSGEMQFTVGPAGTVEVTQPFTIEAAEAAQLFGSSQVVNDLFPGLPERVVRPGDTWIDTVRVQDSSEVGQSSGETVWRYTLQGDTTVAGTRLLHITGEGTSEVSGSGEQSGFSVSQVMSGTLTGTFLWDPAVSLLHTGTTNVDLAGVMSVDAAGGQELSMVLSSRGHVVRTP